MNGNDEMKDSVNKIEKVDYIIMCLIAIVVWVIAATSLGFLRAGFDSPYTYSGGDDFSIMQQAKELLEEKWLWSTSRLGAPYGHNQLEYPSVCLQLPEFLMIKLWGLLTNNYVVAVNLQYVFTYVLCAIIAFIVLRKMSVGRFISFWGAILYAINPYIYGRNIGHYCLTACYFIPIGIFLCYRAYFDTGFLKFGKEFFWKNSMVLLLCILIATNGIGYYPFFTCFYLSVTALLIYVRNKSLKDMIPAIKLVILIVAAMLIALLPTLLYRWSLGGESITIRNPVDMEMYSLKITQLFVPLYSHGISCVQKFINEYNNNMPLVNENTTSYLGVIGAVGFIISIIYIFGYNRKDNKDEDVLFLSKLNLAAVLVMSIGGFISLITVALRVYDLRGFNRISIFISFCSITILCKLLQRYWFDKINDNRVIEILKYFVVIVLLVFGIWEQTPCIFNDGEQLKANKIQWENDEVFVEEIESQLEEGDMVYQLPYHVYPEAGVVNNMNDYQLFVGYLHSDNLRWSYGAYKNSEGAIWNESIEGLEMGEKIDALISAGFKGIYIESRAYTEEELNNLLELIESKLGYKPIISADNKLYFYNLNPYIELNSVK